ncbi:unnamed protein product, partial [Candidula unifasciata]
GLQNTAYKITFVKLSDMMADTSLEDHGNGTSSWMQRVTDSDREIIELVNITFLSGFISAFGIISNVINMLVFYRQGLHTAINIGFFSLAVFDMATLICQIAWAILAALVFQNDQLLPINYEDIQFMTIAYPREGFARDTCMITAFITAERCLCVVFPQT